MFRRQQNAVYLIVNVILLAEQSYDKQIKEEHEKNDLTHKPNNHKKIRYIIEIKITCALRIV